MQPGSERSPETDTDVVVIGAGIAGLAAAVHLAKAGRRVLCIEPASMPQTRVGESLDWSTPGLLAELGLPPDELIRAGVATSKRNIEIVTTGRPLYTAAPLDWLQKPPLLFSVVTLQVDRFALDQRFLDLATRHGVEFLQERVVAMETERNRISSIATHSGRRITARWFIDASGRSTRFLARKFHLARTDYGRTKVCLWRHFETAIHNEGTTFYVDSSQDDYVSCRRTMSANSANWERTSTKS
jgi:menaquinone-9 beta-reductase